MAALALPATAEHASSMASSTTDHNLAVHDDEEVVRSDKRCDAAGPSLATGDRRIVDGRTQSMVLSAPINNPMSRSSHSGPFSVLQSCAAHAEHDSAPMC